MIHINQNEEMSGDVRPTATDPGHQSYREEESTLTNRLFNFDLI